MLWFNTLKGQEQEKKLYIFIIAHVNHELFILKHKINPKLVFLSGKFYKIACRQKSHATTEEDTETVVK